MREPLSREVGQDQFDVVCGNGTLHTRSLSNHIHNDVRNVVSGPPARVPVARNGASQNDCSIRL